MSGHFVGGEWIEGEGPELRSIDPATGETCWSGRAATAAEVGAAFSAARAASASWSESPLEQRTEAVRAFARELETWREELARPIAVETGKPLWDARDEVAAMVAKIEITIDALRERRSPTTSTHGDLRTKTVYRPLGVLAVLGPFNFPGHVPNGHIVPALLAGNTVVFKPSELTPFVAERTLEIWDRAGLPAGVLNLVQGGRETGAAIAAHPEHDGILFTGSYAAGRALCRALADRPEAILALEMGGNNPLVVHEVGDLVAAADLAIRSSALTSGQRCTAARRLIVAEGARGDAFVAVLAERLAKLRVGAWNDDAEPFLGPLVTAAAAERILRVQAALLERGARALVPVEALTRGPAYLRPGLLDVTPVAEREDEEVFGPLLQLVRVADFDAAIEEANRTRYGLVAALASDRRDLFSVFRHRVRAGLVNWNRPTTGASSRLPFGGVGRSGNHRPSGSFAIDYCTDVIATLEQDRLERLPPLPGMLS